MAQDAYSQFQTYNWENDAQWTEYKSKLEIPSDNPNILILKQQKWFKNNVVRSNSIDASNPLSKTF